MREVRIWFSKVGLSRYISHLDLMRTMTRAIRRAKLALPLSLGMESECEAMDIRIEGQITNDDIFDRLSSVMPDGINIKEVTDPVMDPKVIALGRFEISFETDDPSALEKSIDSLLGRDELIVQKLGKKGHRRILKDINLIDFIKEYRIEKGDGELTLFVLLPAGSKENVNPDLLGKCILEETGCSYSLKRAALFNEKLEIFR